MARDYALEAYKIAEQTEVKHNARLNKLEHDLAATKRELDSVRSELVALKRVLELTLVP